MQLEWNAQQIEWDENQQVITKWYATIAGPDMMSGTVGVVLSGVIAERARKQGKHLPGFMREIQRKQFAAGIKDLFSDSGAPVDMLREPFASLDDAKAGVLAALQAQYHQRAKGVFQ